MIAIGAVDELDEEAGDGRSGDRRGGARQLELRVSLHQLVAMDEAREIGLVGDVEEDLERASQERDDVDLPDRQPPREESDRDRREERGAREVGADEDRAPSHPVDPDPGRQREEDPRQEADDAEDSKLQRPGVEDLDRDNGSAMPVISSPNWLMVWAVQSFMKSPWRQRVGRRWVSSRAPRMKAPARRDRSSDIQALPLLTGPVGHVDAGRRSRTSRPPPAPHRRTRQRAR